ncbi:MAG: NAD(P)-dependent alcohol dehydrogenase, partial [Candidatus Nanopelagicales bacterium]
MLARAYGAATAGDRIAPMEVQRREVGPLDVRIDIDACGVCHSDIHQAEGDWGPDIFPMVPGHEIVGIVTEAGAEVTKYQVGDRVGVGCYVASCGSCEACQNGDENYCPTWSTTYNGYEQDGVTPTFGGYSDHIVVNENYVLRIPDGVDTQAVAPLLCAGITVYPPLKSYAGPGKEVGVIGLGGLGHVGVRIAKAMGSRVTVFSHSPCKEADARRIGADGFVATHDPSALKPLRMSFDMILSTVSASIDVDAYLNLLKNRGTLAIVGLPVQPLSFEAGNLVGEARTIVGAKLAGVATTQEMLDFCAEHGIVADVEVIDMADINEAWQRVKDSDVRY